MARLEDFTMPEGNFSVAAVADAERRPRDRADAFTSNTRPRGYDETFGQFAPSDDVLLQRQMDLLSRQNELLHAQLEQWQDSPQNRWERGDSRFRTPTEPPAPPADETPASKAERLTLEKLNSDPDFLRAPAEVQQRVYQDLLAKETARQQQLAEQERLRQEQQVAEQSRTLLRRYGLSTSDLPGSSSTAPTPSSQPEPSPAPKTEADYLEKAKAELEKLPEFSKIQDQATKDALIQKRAAALQEETRLQDRQAAQQVAQATGLRLNTPSATASLSASGVGQGNATDFCNEEVLAEIQTGMAGLLDVEKSTQYVLWLRKLSLQDVDKAKLFLAQTGNAIQNGDKALANNLYEQLRDLGETPRFGGFAAPFLSLVAGLGSSPLVGKLTAGSKMAPGWVRAAGALAGGALSGAASIAGQLLDYGRVKHWNEVAYSAAGGALLGGVTTPAYSKSRQLDDLADADAANAARKAIKAEVTTEVKNALAASAEQQRRLTELTARLNKATPTTMQHIRDLSSTDAKTRNAAITALQNIFTNGTPRRTLFGFGDKLTDFKPSRQQLAEFTEIINSLMPA